MQHHFNTDIAKQYDIVTAVLLDNFYYWIEKNKANEKNYIDGHYWTYNTRSAMAKMFPYLTERQIEYAITKMVNNGLIITANHNENKTERKLWYAITNFGYSILQNCEMYNNIYITNTKTNIKENNIKESLADNEKFSEEEAVKWFDSIYSLFPRKVSKVKAKEAFEHKIRGLSKEEAYKKAVAIYKMLEKQILLWNKENKEMQFIPYPASWLNSNVEDSPHFKKGRKK